MIYIFEDKEDDLLSRLFLENYDKGRRKDFIYTNGNGRIVEAVAAKLKETSEQMVVYLDTIPGNGSIWNIYCELRRMAHKNPGRLLILPIVCSEYYFIKSIANELVLTYSQDVEVCLKRGIYFNTLLYNKDGKTRDYCKNFEKYCKLILMTSVEECVKHTRTDNAKYGFYYTQNCLCTRYESWCQQKILRYKSLRFISVYPGIILHDTSGEAAVRELYGIHKQLVDQYNKMATDYEKADKTKRYKMIKEIDSEAWLKIKYQ